MPKIISWLVRRGFSAFIDLTGEGIEGGSAVERREEKGNSEGNTVSVFENTSRSSPRNLTAFCMHTFYKIFNSKICLQMESLFSKIRGGSICLFWRQLLHG